MNRINTVFVKMGEFLVDKLGLDRPGRGKLELQQDLVSLSTGRKLAVRNYYVTKVSTFLKIMLTGMVLAGISLMVFSAKKDDTEMQILERPGYGEGDRKEVLNVLAEGTDVPESVEITVQERKYTDQQMEELLDKAQEELEQQLLGENESLDEIRHPLHFPNSLQNSAVEAGWMTIPYGVINEEGEIVGAECEEGTLVEIRAVLTCGTREKIFSVYANVMPPVLSAEDSFRQSIRKEVEAADARDSSKEVLKLPEQVEGKALLWKRDRKNPFGIILVLTLVAAVCIYIEMDSRTHQKAEERRRQLMLDYPDLMWKMTMLLGAGLSIKGTFTRIAEEYLRAGKHRKNGEKGKARYVYEEVVYACFEMENGVPEAQAYERFGKRCQLPEYIRLGTVLSQNLKKGARGLTLILQTEAESSLTERKNHARKIGEKAGTKMLFPMILMLGIVLTILMVPAFLSF